MKKPLMALAAAALAPTVASAGGLDRTGQPVDLIFEEGNYAQASFFRINPDVTGNDLTAEQTPSGDIAPGFNQVAAGLRYELTDQLSVTLIYNQPWQTDVAYQLPSGDPSQPGSVRLGGTFAEADSDALTAILRYKFENRFSVHGGVRYQELDGSLGLQGTGYGAFSGYQIDLARDGAFGWLVGGAYEIPEMALRVALTYQSAITHNFASTETSPLFGTINSSREVKTPQSVNLDFRSGVAKDTLVFGSIRWVDHSQTQLNSTPVGPIPSVGLIDIVNTTTYRLGVARRLNENWAASLAFGYEPRDSDDLVSPLLPANGFKSVTVGLQYTDDKIKVSGGVQYAVLGDAFAETGTPDRAQADFTDNDALSFGVTVGFKF
ncbi:OmpP1/FadL family transporter [Ruegeria jejuensis]|uniref:OmpP1/FadL family transporter n=1 Tax=Ruegeria jejuensis TaxID=3233338 RepID=UPI00355B590F